MNNYPPGVSGNEPEIVGYPDVEPFTYAELQTLYDMIHRRIVRVLAGTEWSSKGIQELYALREKIEAHMEAS